MLAHIDRFVESGDRPPSIAGTPCSRAADADLDTRARPVRPFVAEGERPLDPDYLSAAPTPKPPAERGCRARFTTFASIYNQKEPVRAVRHRCAPAVPEDVVEMKTSGGELRTKQVTGAAASKR